jgi:hypothetical protein
MSKTLTLLASSIVFIAGIANARNTISTKINPLDTACFSSLEREGPIFISLSLDFDNPRRAGFIQYKNGPRIPLKFLSYEDLTAPGARLISYSFTYAEIVNKKRTGYYTYTWQGGDVPSLVYLSKNRKKDTISELTLAHTTQTHQAMNAIGPNQIYWMVMKANNTQRFPPITTKAGRIGRPVVTQTTY